MLHVANERGYIRPATLFQATSQQLELLQHGSGGLFFFAGSNDCKISR
jgi:hypothetical protein